MVERAHCFNPGLGYLIIVWVIIATISLALSYAIALSNGHISPYIPAISDATSRNPEGAIFAEFFNITAFLSLVIMSVRYVQVRMLNQQVQGGDSSKLFQLNSLSFVFGVASALGATIVANFRSSKLMDGMEMIHAIGSAMLFISSAAYCWTQTAITHQLTKFNFDTKPIFTARLVITILQTIATLAFLVSWGIAYAKFGKSSLPGTTSQLTPEHEGFPIYATGNVTQWLAAWCLGLFGVSFFKEFQKISLNVQCIPKFGGLRSDALKYTSMAETRFDESSESD